MTIPSTMQALQLQKLGDLELGMRPVPQPKAREVLIRTVATTICTSDINDIAGNPFGIALPRVLGHEGAGIVASVGPEVETLRPGDRVATHPVISCGRCASCLRGLGHLCENMGHLGYDRDGSFAEYYAIPADRARKIPDDLSLVTASLLEPVAVCLQAVRRGAVGPGKTVLVMGDGPFGLMIARLCVREGAACVILVGKEPFRLSQVPEVQLIDASKTDDVTRAIAHLTAGDGVDIGILAVASADAFAVCLSSLRRRGRLVVFSHMPDDIPVSLGQVHIKEMEIVGACNDEDYVDESLACLCDPELRLDRLITHRVPFSDWPLAFELASQRKSEALKVALIFDPEAA